MRPMTPPLKSIYHNHLTNRSIFLSFVASSISFAKASRILSFLSYWIDSRSFLRSKIIDEEELEKYMAGGWDVQNMLASGRILIRKN